MGGNAQGGRVSHMANARGSETEIARQRQLKLHSIVQSNFAYGKHHASEHGAIIVAVDGDGAEIEVCGL